MTDNELDYQRPTDEQILKETVTEKLRMVSEVPGLMLEFDPDEAELAGAFQEDAMSIEDAWEARFDARDDG